MQDRYEKYIYDNNNNLIKKIGSGLNETWTYQYHFDDYFNESIKQYEVKDQPYTYEILVELTSTFESFDLAYSVIRG